jgi:subtilisin family serine protease
MIDGQLPEDHSSFPSKIEGGGVVLTLAPDQLYVTFVETPPSELDAFLAQYRLHPVLENPASAHRSDLRKTVPDQQWLQSATGENTARFINEIRSHDRVATAAPVYHRADLAPRVTGLSFVNQLLVRFHPHAAKKEIGALIGSLGIEDVALMPDAREGPLHQLRLRDPKRQEMFVVIRELVHSSLVRYAGPDWIQLHSPLAAIPNDRFYPDQWALPRIGAPAGWDIETGDPSIVIAIVDTGCDPNQPDLVSQYVSGLDLLGGPVGDADDTAPGTGHGTCCAGIAAAEWNNIIGVAGVAPDCRIMPIRVFKDSSPTISITETNIVKALDWARMNGARVVNMSFAYDGLHPNADIALNNAYMANMVLVAAAGNCFLSKGCTAPQPVSYPASHPRVIAVGASDQDDLRYHVGSTDTSGLANDWESNYGPELSVVAPTAIITTTTEGTWFHFNGTSAAAPHVAGLAALLMSLLQHVPLMSFLPGHQHNDLVRFIIERTAAKVGGYGYANDMVHPSGTWNEEMGYGRIDMAAALQFARDNYTHYKFDYKFRNWDYRAVVLILFGLTGGGGGIVEPPGGPPVPVDPGLHWQHLTPQMRNVLLGLATAKLAEAVSDPESRRAIQRAAGEAIERSARQIGHD